MAESFESFTVQSYLNESQPILFHIRQMKRNKSNTDIRACSTRSVHVTSMEPAVLVNHVVCGLLVAMVTLHILRSLHTQLSDLVVSDASSGFRINDLKQVSVSG